ncbi:MAG: PhnD/SsuA/transferrin family substrate-binding protein [Proteobacteria bacterium]|nr:PhnD/SsuA/transferrin family substrate-binding protein [Pseudomonadota bacterium]
MKIKLLIFFWLISFQTVIFNVKANADTDVVESVTIGILAFRPKPEALAKWGQLSDALNRDIAEYHFKIKLMGYRELEQAVANCTIDFVLTNPGHYVLMHNQYGLSSPLATMVKNINGQPVSAFGGVIFTRSDNTSINQLQDITKHKIATVKTSSLGGYQMQAYEFLDNQLPVPHKSQLVLTGMPHDKVVRVVLNGQADVGFVRTGILESMQKEGKLDLKQIKILQKQNLSDFPYQSSTNLYPEWPFSALPHVDIHIKTTLLGYLLLLPHDGELAISMGLHGFDVSANYSSVEKMIRELRIPPFDFIPDISVRDILQIYRLPLGVMSLLIAFIIIISAVLWIINRRLIHTRYELIQHKESLSNIIWSTQVGTWEWNIQTGDTIFNERWAELLGYTLAELSPVSIQTWKELIHPDDLIIAEQYMQNYFTEQTGFFETDFRMKHKKGRWVWINARGQLTKRNKDGSPLWMSGTHTDISKRKKAEEALAKLNNQLEQKVLEGVEKNKQQQLMLLQQSRLAQMGEMISMIAHQWRQPLNNLAILTQTIALKYARGKLNDSLMNDFNTNSSKQIQGMSKTIDDFRSFFKPDKEKKEFCVTKVIEDTIEMLHPTLNKNNITLIFESTQKLYSIGFPNELGQALVNTINNAKDALMDNDKVDKKITISLLLEDPEIIINISDNAGGIPADIIDNIYEPYFSTKENKNSTGLGLYMTKLIIEDHLGGKIIVSNRNEGANFMIRLDSTSGQGKD